MCTPSIPRCPSNVFNTLGALSAAKSLVTQYFILFNRSGQCVQVYFLCLFTTVLKNKTRNQKKGEVKTDNQQRKCLPVTKTYRNVVDCTNSLSLRKRNQSRGSWEPLFFSPKPTVAQQPPPNLQSDLAASTSNTVRHGRKHTSCQ